MPLPAWIVQVLIAIAMQVLALVMTPRPKGPKPAEVEQGENPTAEAGKPIPKLWGTARVSETNVIGFWDKSTRQYKVKM